MVELAHLLNDHGRLIAMAESLLSVVASVDPMPGKATRELQLLGDTLDLHMMAEANILQHGKGSALSVSRSRSPWQGAQFRTLVRDWVAYLNAWPEHEVRREWRSFSRATMAIIRRLVVQVELENEAIRAMIRSADFETRTFPGRRCERDRHPIDFAKP